LNLNFFRFVVFSKLSVPTVICHCGYHNTVYIIHWNDFSVISEIGNVERVLVDDFVNSGFHQTLLIHPSTLGTQIDQVNDILSRITLHMTLDSLYSSNSRPSSIMGPKIAQILTKKADIVAQSIETIRRTVCIVGNYLLDGVG